MKSTCQCNTFEIEALHLQTLQRWIHNQTKYAETFTSCSQNSSLIAGKIDHQFEAPFTFYWLTKNIFNGFWIAWDIIACNSDSKIHQNLNYPLYHLNIPVDIITCRMITQNIPYCPIWSKDSAYFLLRVSRKGERSFFNNVKKYTLLS